MKRNVSGPERVVRMALGSTATAVGIVLLLGGPSLWAAVGSVLLAAAGLDLFVTGASGYCPLYARLGHLPRSPQGQRR